MNHIQRVEHVVVEPEGRVGWKEGYIKQGIHIFLGGKEGGGGGQRGFARTKNSFAP